MKILHWFRADLRLTDNKALHAAIKQATSIIALFIITPETWKRHHAAACKIRFILENIKILSENLAAKGIPLLVKKTDYFSQCPQLIQDICSQYQIDALYFNKQYEYDERRRDKKVHALLRDQLIIKSYDDQCILAPGIVKNKQDAAFKVFTPFQKTWLSIAAESSTWQPLTTPRKNFNLCIEPDNVAHHLKQWTSDIDLSHWPAGETVAKKRLNHFCQSHLLTYHRDRDFPAKSATSQLSPYLAQGIISPRQCIKKIMDVCQTDQFSTLTANEGCAVWLSELIWREFYKHIMFFYPKICQYKAFRTETDRLPWGDNQQHYHAWCVGQTGFPLVDAAMRQLNQTGWMHNRLRMVVAMFLSKTLFLDWRLGERYFMQHLIDGDLAANNGGWQWSASTGTDAVPYFRIFNPTTQSQRFDADGTFIRQYCPELKDLDNKTIHAPYASNTNHKQLNYPKPIVCYSTMRKKVINIFKENA